MSKESGRLQFPKISFLFFASSCVIKSRHGSLYHNDINYILIKSNKIDKNNNGLISSVISFDNYIFRSHVLPSGGFLSNKSNPFELKC
jgi:hypothetical protein